MRSRGSSLTSIHIISIHIDIIVMRCCAALSVRHMTTARRSLPSLSSRNSIQSSHTIFINAIASTRTRSGSRSSHECWWCGWILSLSCVCVSVPFPFSFCRLSSRLLLSCTPHPIILNLSHNRIDTVISYRIISIISYHHRHQGTIPYTLVDGTYLPLKMMLLRSCPTDNQLLFRPRSLPTKYSNW